jgi:hypothetical protein
MRGFGRSSLLLRALDVFRQVGGVDPQRAALVTEAQCREVARGGVPVDPTTAYAKLRSGLICC